MAVIMDPSAISAIVFDCTVDEVHTSSAKITAFPVEDGIDVSDNVRREPHTLRLHTITSTTPLDEQRRKRLAKGDDLIAEAYDLLQLHLAEGTRLDVLTTRRAYTNMVIVSIEFPHDSKTANVLDATITLREIRTATSRSVRLPHPRKTFPRAAGKVDAGRVATKPAEAPVQEKSQSVLLQAGRGARGALQ
jgi:hypothetical protein